MVNQALKKHKANHFFWHEEGKMINLPVLLQKDGERMIDAWLRRGNIRMTGKYSAEPIMPPELAITPPTPAPKKGFFKRLFRRR